MKRRNKLILVIVFIGIAFAIGRFLKHTYIFTDGYKGAIYTARVIDGDTIKLANGEEVRYIGIDTPELREKIKNRWEYVPRPYAEEAKAFNQKLVEKKLVRLEFDVQRRDKYNRLLAYVYPVSQEFPDAVPPGDRMVNLEMVREGYAMIYTYPPNVKYSEKFLQAQQYARENKKGLWASLERESISTSEAKHNIGLIKMVEAYILNTYISDRVLILNCRDNFKIVIFKDNLACFPKMSQRSPDTFFKHKTVKVYGLIKDYKGSYEIVVNDPSQLEILGLLEKP